MKLWRPRFSLRTLLVLVTLTCVYFAAWEVTMNKGVRDISEDPFARDVRSPIPFVVGANVLDFVEPPVGAPRNVGQPLANELSEGDVDNSAGLSTLNGVAGDFEDNMDLIGPVQIEYVEAMGVYRTGGSRRARPILLPSLMRRHFVWFFGWAWETPIRWEVDTTLDEIRYSFTSRDHEDEGLEE